MRFVPRWLKKWWWMCVLKRTWVEIVCEDILFVHHTRTDTDEVMIVKSVDTERGEMTVTRPQVWKERSDQN